MCPALRALLVLLAGLLSAGAARADVLDIARLIHARGCDGRSGVHAPLRTRPELLAAAQHWARGATLHTALLQSGYRQVKSSAIHISGDEAAVAETLRARFCAALTDPMLSDMGGYRRGDELWIILGAPFMPPSQADTPLIAESVLKLVNQARARGRYCGAHAFGPAPPLRLASLLGRAATEHALDMAQHDYFAHEDRSGRSPADRVRALGYREQLVGENVAEGPTTADEVVRGWLASPGHCENIMNAEFSELGVGFAASSGAEPRVYWVQDFAAPR
jgi:uncharacterized protein YkwD